MIGRSEGLERSVPFGLGLAVEARFRGFDFGVDLGLGAVLGSLRGGIMEPGSWDGLMRW